MPLARLIPSLALAIAPLSPAPADPEAPAAAPPIELTTARPSDRASLSRDGESSSVTISSETGIGSATLSRTGPTWPPSLSLHLELAGLESLVLDDGERRVEISVASHGERAVLQSVTSQGQTVQLDPDHPLWTHVEILEPGPVRPGRPPAGFKLLVPRQLLSRDSLSVRWIDFYRG